MYITQRKKLVTFGKIVMVLSHKIGIMGGKRYATVLLVFMGLSECVFPTVSLLDRGTLLCIFDWVVYTLNKAD